MAMSEAARKARNDYFKEWRKNNKDKVNNYNRRYRADNPDKVKEWEGRRWESIAAKSHEVCL